ncbi:MAG TPA: alpha/beta hydrolase [Cytophagales bacterium]|nr:alpha/beta hydrolase [Cytophagales bacterium]
MEKLFTYKNVTICYSIWGSGSKSILTFHGFGQTKASFRPFEKVFEEYTFYNFDLFFHGKSLWNEQAPYLTKEFWGALISAFLTEHHIRSFSLVGYSMGGKFVLAILEKFPDQIERIILIAPDGIKTSFWYSLATYPYWIRVLFKKTIHDPLLFKRFVRLIRAFRLVDKSLLKFAETQMDTEEKRARVYFSWVVFRALKFDMDIISSFLNRHQIILEVFLGKYDKMITEKNLQDLLNKVTNFKMNILETGHNKLIAEVAEYYKNNENGPKR